MFLKYVGSTSNKSENTQFLLLQGMKGYELPKKLSKSPKEEQGMAIGGRFGYTSKLILLMELRKKIMTFRDILDLPPCDGSASINEVSFPNFLLQLKNT